MKCSKVWLKEWVDIELSTKELVEALTMAGLEVDSVEPAAIEFSKIVVGEVLTVEPHPNADKLHVCQVNVGKERLTIVCGAANVRPKLKVPTALIGAKLPNLTIQKVKLRGVESGGMMCSPKELGFSKDHQGLLEFPEDAPVGTDIREYLNLDDEIIDVALTPNRGDCASILGIAREISAITQKSLHQKDIKPVKPASKDIFPVNLVAESACPRYVGRIIRHLNSKAKTPIFMQEKLRRSGINPIHPVVDVTNYVLLELGQPMHAFDFDKLHQHIDVRFAKKNESLALLNGQMIKLSQETLVIADAQGSVAIAGVMGGADSAVSETTQHIFLESAFFKPEVIAGKAREYGLQTDSSFRFERGVDWQLQQTAIEYATQLLLDIMGGEAGPVIEAKSDQHLPIVPTVSLRRERVGRLLGESLPQEKIMNILNRLNMQVDIEDQTFKVQPPSYRFDISIEEDLIEEIARIYGYNAIPDKPYFMPMIGSPLNPTEQIFQKIRYFFRDRAYHEIISYTFIDPQDQKLFDPDQTPLVLDNPIAQNMSVMRTNLWPGLVNTLVYNLNHQQTRVRLFETGLRFIHVDHKLEQQEVIAGLIYGDMHKRQWNESSRSSDFYDLKGDLEALFRLMSFAQMEYREVSHPALHPGQSSAIYQDEKLIGYVGALHPSLLQMKDIDRSVYVFELFLDKMSHVKRLSFEPISKFPAIRRDIAIVVSHDISIHQILKAIQENLGNLLIDLEVFDIFEGKDIAADKKSVALGLTLQDMSHTLNEKEICDLMDQLLKMLTSNFGATLRK
ncbi:MAG: phenylalanine--tRNA ligase subunit beta [Gammaproteobacteria bacterium]|nr:phenylalanine--tRNA ligase subunit beta [Gammaproteobacteria bacterium]